MDCEIACRRIQELRVLSIAVLLVLIVCGCKARQDDHLNVGLAGEGEAHGKDRVPAMVLEHDMGLISPGGKHAHTFEIRNSGAHPWTISQIVKSCSCTATRVFSRTIPPGQSGRIEITYHAAYQDQDFADSKSVKVEFSEPDAPAVNLVMKGRIRHLLSLSPSALNFRRVGAEDAAEQWFEVRNFSGRVFKTMSVTSEAKWLATQVVEVSSSQPRSVSDPLQLWRVTVKTDPKQLQPGSNAAIIKVSPDRADLSRQVKVWITSSPPFFATPRQLFFGAVSMGAPARRKVWLRVAPDQAGGSDRGLCSLTHTLGNRLSLRWSNVESAHWEFEAILTPQAGDRFIEGEITVAHPNKALPELKIPVTALLDSQ